MDGNLAMANQLECPDSVYRRRIIFVGVHNKPDMEPLDSRSKSGKLINRVIYGLQIEVGLFEAEFIKTNLFHPTITWFPADANRIIEVYNWITRNRVKDDDIVITLGHIVNEAFRKAKVESIKLGHPSGVWSNLKQEEYIINACIKVSEVIKTVNPI